MSLDRPRNETRDVADPRAMRALAHPVRLALLDALGIHGPLTATEAGEAIGESPTTCSFHFRQLAKYGFVEEAGAAPGGAGPGGWRTSACTSPMSTTIRRPPPQRPRSTGSSVNGASGACGPAWRPAPATRASGRRSRAQASSCSTSRPKELRALDGELTELLTRHRDRVADPARRPEGSRPVEMLVFAYRVED